MTTHIQRSPRVVPLVAVALLLAFGLAGAIAASDHATNSTAQPSRVSAQSRRAWNYGYLTSLANASKGGAIQFELTEGQQAVGTIREIERRNGEVISVSGSLAEPEPGRFHFQKQRLPGKQGDFAGVVEFPQSKTAWRIEPTGPGGKSELVQHRLDEVLCLLPPPTHAGQSGNAEEMPPLDPSDVPDYVPAYNDGIISLQSRPGSVGVLYIDYRGGYTPTWGGITYEKPNVNNAQIKDVWKRVAEDYMPFDINVTTDIQVFDAAPEGSRQRCICTPTTTAAPGAGGVSYLGSWNWGGDTPNWSFYSTGKDAAEVVSHEVGHALGLSHDGRTSPSEGYYGGQGSGSVGWAPIMGVGYYQPVAQWSKGEYANANNTEDDLNKIVSNNNNVDYRADDNGSTLATARYLEAYSGNTVSAEGVIERTADTDAFQFTTTGGTVTIQADPAPGDWADLAIMATLADASDSVIATSNPQSQLNASITTVLSAGTYTFRVTGAGRNDPASTGFSSYASLGYYSITGTVAGIRLPSRFTLNESRPNGTVVGTVTANGAGTLAYTIVSGNASSAFALNNSGVLTVANSSALNYETLALNTQTTVQYEMFVNITNLTTPALTETNRRVVVQVLDVNEPPAVTGFTNTVYANTPPGTVIGAVTGTDPDFYAPPPVYSIVSGNSNNVFAIGSQTGVVTVNGPLPTSMSGLYNLTVQATDGSTNALANVRITVQPGYSGVWANAAGGAWPTTGNWSGGVVAGGIGETANFATLNITADRTVTLDGGKPVGHLIFGDTTPSHNWTMNTGSGGPLTLSVASNTPTITVSNQTATINAVMAGGNGLTKMGAGTLTLGGANTFAGGITLSRGTLVANHASALGATNNTLMIGDANTGTNSLNLNVDTGIAGTVTLAALNTTSYGTNPTITLNAGSALGANVSDLTITTLNLNGNRPLTIKAQNTGSHSTAQDIAYRLVGSGVPAGSTALTLDGSAASLRTSFPNGSAANNFTGDVVIKGAVSTQGTTYNGQTPENQNLGFLNNSMTVSAGATWRIVWGGETVGALNGSGGINLDCQNALNNIGLTVGANGVNGSFSGAITGGFGLAKSGAGTQVLSGVSSYSGPTMINAGALLVNGAGSLPSGAVTVASAGTFGGTGTVNGAVTVNGTLAPGNNGIGTFSVNNTLTLLGNVRAEINKSAATADRVQGVTTLNYGGTLTVTNLAGTLTTNDTFTLFTAAIYSGNFDGINLPVLGAGMAWDVSLLPVNGSITIVGFTGINPPASAPTGVAATAVSASQINVTWAAVADATSYIVSRDGMPIVTVSGTSYSDAGLSTATTYCYTVTAVNSGGSSSASPSACATTLLAGVTVAWDANPGVGGVQDGSGTWGNSAANWFYGGTNWPWADANDATFGVNTTTNCTVTVTNDVTPTGISFKATGGGSYTVAGGGGINLSGTIPIVASNNATINAVLKGTGTLLKRGPSALTLGAANTYSGATTISQGRLQLNVNNALPATANIVIGDANSGATAPNLYLGSQLNPTFATLTVGSNVTGAALHTSGWAPTVSGVTTLNSPLTIKQYDGGYVHTGIQNNGRITGSGAGSGNDTLIFQYGGSQNFYWQANNTVANDFLGNIRITGAAGNMNAQGGANGPNNVVIPDTAMVVIDSGCFFRWNNFGNYAVVETFDGLAGAGSMSRNNAGGLISSLALTINASNPSNEGKRVFTGSLVDMNSLSFTGTGTQIFAGPSISYTTPTTINGGTLLLSNATAFASAVTVNYGGRFGGTGASSGAVTVNNGGTLSPGLNNVGTLNVNNTLSLAGNALFKLSKTGGVRTNDLVKGMTSVAYGGTLAVTNITSDSNALASGDAFKLFNTAAYGGAFQSFTLPTLPNGLHWNTGTLATDGTIAVAVNTYTVTYNAGANGNITGTSPQTVNYGASGTAVNATPNTGYHFVNWSDGSTANPRTDSNVTSNFTVTANFAINTYTLTYNAGTNGSISGTTPQTVNHGGGGSAVTAVADAGYAFTNWSDGLTQNPRTDSGVTNDFTVTANFVTLATTDLPAPWTTNKIGTIAATVSATHSAGTFTVVGGGANISGKNDSFWFVNQPFSSNATITARVVSEQDTGAAAKAGVMMRESTATGSRSVFMGLTPTSGAQWVRRSSTGGNSSTTTSAGKAAPYWVRLTRNGNTFTGYLSTNGAAWTQVASASLSMSNSYSLGMAVCSGGGGTTNLSVFDNVAVTNVVIASALPSTPPMPAAISSLTLSPDLVNFSVTGEAGSVWQLEESTDLINWIPVQSVTLIDGAIQHSEEDLTQPRRFFRLIWTP